MKHKLYYICTSKYGVMLDCEPYFNRNLVEDAYKKAGPGAKLEVMESGIRKTIKTK